MALVTALPAALDAQLKRDSGLNTFEYHVLVQLGEAPEHRLPMSALAFAAHGSPSRISHAVRRLEQAGWVERMGSCEEGHRVDARLTDAGHAKLVASAAGHAREARRLVVDALTAEQFAALGDAARGVISTIDPAIAATLCNGMISDPADDLLRGTLIHPLSTMVGTDFGRVSPASRRPVVPLLYRR